MGMVQKVHLNDHKTKNMSDKKKTNDLLGKYIGKDGELSPMEQSAKLVKSESGYQAVIELTAAHSSHKTLKGQFGIFGKNGDFDYFDYHHVIKRSFKQGVVMLTTTTDIICLRGQNLKSVAECFAHKKACAVYEFNPIEHKQPPADQPIIETIEWQ